MSASELAGIHRKKEAILALEKMLDREVCVEVAGGSELKGVLKGFDSNLNVVLANAEQRSMGGAVRKLGAAVVHGSNVTTVLPASMEAIANPFE